MLQAAPQQMTSNREEQKLPGQQGTRGRAGAGRTHRVDHLAEMRRLEGLDEEARHTTGYLYGVANGTVYDPEQILRKNEFWFEPALPMPFRVNDCIVHAFNYLFRHPVFVMREQVHRLAQARSKKSCDYLIGCKLSKGYPPVMFNNFIVKGKHSYVIEITKAIEGSQDLPAWKQLQTFVQAVMVECHVVDELLLVGKLLDEEGNLVTHSSTFIRLDRYSNKKKEVTPLVLHLDSNFPKPQCSAPPLLGVDADLLNWKGLFGKYESIKLFQLFEEPSYDDEKHARRLQFAKDIIEGVAAPSSSSSQDEDERTQLMSSRGQRGREAAAKTSHQWRHRKQRRCQPKPAASGQTIIDLDVEDDEDEDQTLDYDFGDHCKL